MKILHIGPKNYPPAYGGIEKVVYDISQGMKNVQYYVLVQWPQMETDSVKVLPHNIFKQIKLILSFAKINKISALHFHKEVMIPHTIITSVLGKKTVFTMHGCAWRVPKWAWYYRIASYMLDLAACTFTSRVAFVGEADHRQFSKVVFWRKLYYVPNGIETNSLICSDDTSKCVL